MDRAIKPYEEIKAMLGDASSSWEKLIGQIRYLYVCDEVWVEGNPKGKHHSNLYIRRGGKALTSFFFREGYFMACVVLGKDEREKFDQQRETFGAAVCKEYDSQESLHDGKWLGFEMHGKPGDTALIDDIIRLLHIKRKPNRKVLPESLEKCGRLDIGLSHEEITNSIMA